MEKNLVKKLLSFILEDEDGNENEKQSPSSPTEDGGIRIVILQRGWVYVGEWNRRGDECWLDNAKCIRSWGTTNGLGEIAEGGPTSSTKLEPTPTVRFHRLCVVASIDCNSSKWNK